MTATLTLSASVFPRLYRDSVALLALASTLQQREHISLEGFATRRRMGGTRNTGPRVDCPPSRERGGSAHRQR